jgi:hypothetical protein
MTACLNILPATRWGPVTNTLAASSSSTSGDLANIFEIKFDAARHEVVFDVAHKPVREGDWVAIMLGQSSGKSSYDLWTDGCRVLIGNR